MSVCLVQLTLNLYTVQHQDPPKRGQSGKKTLQSLAIFTGYLLCNYYIITIFTIYLLYIYYIFTIYLLCKVLLFLLYIYYIITIPPIYLLSMNHVFTIYSLCKTPTRLFFLFENLPRNGAPTDKDDIARHTNLSVWEGRRSVDRVSFGSKRCPSLDMSLTPLRCCVCVCVFVRVYLYICICGYMCIYLYMYIYVCICVCIVYTHTPLSEILPRTRT